MEAPYSDISFKNLTYNEENVWVNSITFKFYHDQNCDKCNFCSPGWNDLRSEGPWDFTCSKCGYRWSIVMTLSAKRKRIALLKLLRHIDKSIENAKNIDRRFVQKHIGTGTGYKRIKENITCR